MGVDITNFSANKKDPKLKKQLNPHGPILLVTGRIVEQKGLHFLLDAMPQILEKFPATQLVVVGDGPYKETLLLQANKLKIDKNVNFVGRIPNNDLPRYYASSDIFIGPSITLVSGETEGFGVVFLEAMASKLPVIGTNVGGIPDIILNNKTGLLVEQRKPDQLADACISLLGNKTLRQNLVETSLDVIKEKFSWSAVSKRFDSDFQKL